MATAKLLIFLQIDDAVDAVPVHMSCGIWGLLAGAIFASESLVEDIYGFTNSKGLIYGGDGLYLVTALLFIVCSIGWSCAVMIPFFFFCDKMGLMKYTDKEIADMLDVKSHGNIYDMVNMQGTPDHVYSTASERDSNGHENPKSSYFLGEIHNEGNALLLTSTSLNDSTSTRADSAAFRHGWS